MLRYLSWITLLLFCFTLVFCKKKPPSRYEMMRKIALDLSFNPEQMREVERSIRRMQETDRHIHEARPGHMEDMIATLRRDRITLEEALSLDGRMDALHRRSREVMIEEFVRLHGLMTPEQKNKLADRLLAEHERRLKSHPPPPPFDPAAIDHKIH
ncbi:MAG: hypothetical protein HS115_15045 [Spirochaetales bacterium]|nr:hypothetical protein [Spirochaetales bacterium]